MEAQNKKAAKILVVGAGGIGCELLKNLVMSDFHNITVIDLDTIDVSNLNRQFLFRREHVGKSKSKIAVQAALAYAPQANITALHGNIKEERFGPSYFRGFDLVLNALDNLSARRHVNRLCLSSQTPLVESGTQGFQGQVFPIFAGTTECFECQPHPQPTRFPVCTIRNTPDQPVHCVVWAKSVFNALFGPVDPESYMDRDSEQKMAEIPDCRTLATEADSVDFFQKLFDWYFKQEILLQQEKKERWSDRRPVPVAIEQKDVFGSSDPVTDDPERDWVALSSSHSPLEMLDSVQNFRACTHALLKERRSQLGGLEWDKDDPLAMVWVGLAARLRMHNFHITPAPSMFSLKGIAGNIVHAIATTNAMAAGLIVMEAEKLLAGLVQEPGQKPKPQTPLPPLSHLTWIRETGPKVLQPQSLDKPIPSCFVCGNVARRLTLVTDITKFTLRQLYEVILKGSLSMSEPSIDIPLTGNSPGTLEDAMEDDPDYVDRPLKQVQCPDGAMVMAEDEIQQIQGVEILIQHNDLDTQQEHVKDYELQGLEGLDTSAPLPSPTTTTGGTPETAEVEIDLLDSDNDGISDEDTKIEKAPSEALQARPVGRKRAHAELQDAQPTSNGNGSAHGSQTSPPRKHQKPSGSAEKG